MTRFTIASESKLELVLYLVKQAKYEDDSDVMRRLREIGMSREPFASTIGDRRIRLDKNLHNLGRCQNISKILPLFRNHFKKKSMEYNNGINSVEPKRKELLHWQQVLKILGEKPPILTSQSLTAQCHALQSLAQKYLVLEGNVSRSRVSRGQGRDQISGMTNYEKIEYHFRYYGDEANRSDILYFLPDDIRRARQIEYRYQYYTREEANRSDISDFLPDDIRRARQSKHHFQYYRREKANRSDIGDFLPDDIRRARQIEHHCQQRRQQTNLLYFCLLWVAGLIFLFPFL